jgi:hypothetical protein
MNGALSDLATNTLLVAGALAALHGLIPILTTIFGVFRHFAASGAGGSYRFAERIGRTPGYSAMNDPDGDSLTGALQLPAGRSFYRPP